MIHEGDKVRLKSGEIARIAEVLAQGKMYIGEIIRADKHVEIDHVAHEDIFSVFEEIERPLTKAV